MVTGLIFLPILLVILIALYLYWGRNGNGNAP
jgi:hypothetical protein